MIDLNRRPARKKRDFFSLQILLWGIGICFFLLLCFGIYSMLRRSMERLTMDYYYPFLKIARVTENSIADKVLLMQKKTTLVKALRILQNDNTILAAERTVVNDLKKENAELRALLGLGRKGTFSPIFAEVLSRDSMTWQEQFIIDKGSRHGIEPGNPVVVTTHIGNNAFPAVAVIGKVKSVSGHTAVVSTILSQDFKMSVSLPGSNSSGILEGARKITDMRAILRFLPLQSTPASGQIVYTNSFSGNSPPGLPVGTITDYTRPSAVSRNDQIYIETLIRPFESPAEVRFVAVFVKDRK
ncbi:MAG: rod shape-determining protein MreC [Lentisphaeria bacterium]|nr:rod shape-determining protein MreC [Lentisphaeria bacterium]